MIKTRVGCPICHTLVAWYSGNTNDPKLRCNCENGHFWLEYTVQDIIIGGQTDEKMESTSDTHTTT